MKFIDSIKSFADNFRPKKRESNKGVLYLGKDVDAPAPFIFLGTCRSQKPSDFFAHWEAMTPEQREVEMRFFNDEARAELLEKLGKAQAELK